MVAGRNLYNPLSFGAYSICGRKKWKNRKEDPSQERGDSGIGNLAQENHSLLSIWKWRFGVEREILWTKSFASKYAVKIGVEIWEEGIVIGNHKGLRMILWNWEIRRIWENRIPSFFLNKRGKKMLVSSAHFSYFSVFCFENCLVLLSPPRVEATCWTVIRT